MINVKSILLVSIIIFLSFVARSELKPFGKSEGWIVGAAVVSDWSAYQGVENKRSTTLPYVGYEWENASIAVTGFSYEFFESSLITTSLLVEPRWSFTDPQDSPIFTDIERDVALEAGFKGVVDLNILEVSGTYLQDISDVHNGSELLLQIGTGGEVLGIDISLSAGYAYKSANLNMHLYGVSEAESQANLPTFSIGGRWQAIINAELFYPIRASSCVLIFAQYERIHSSMQASPLISKNRDANVGIAFLTRF